MQGSKSVEVRPVGVSKGASLERMLQHMAGELSAGWVAWGGAPWGWAALLAGAPALPLEPAH